VTLTRNDLFEFQKDLEGLLTDNRPITVWEKWNKVSKAWVHNHIEDGYSPFDRPTATDTDQVAAWRDARWRKTWAELIDGKVVRKYESEKA
jgi:hypothetical protein